MKFNNIALVAATALTIVGCGCGGNQQSTDLNNSATGLGNQAANGAGGKKIGKHLKVGIVFDSGGRGDKSFNDSAWRGVEMAKKDMDIEERGVDSRQPKDYETNLEGLASGGYDIVFAVGITQKKALETIAPKFPKTKFAIIDAEVKGDNVRSLTFTEQEGSFLAGYLAGLTTKTNKIGFVGGMKLPLIKKFEVGYAAGARAANPKVEILPAKYTDNWDNIDTGKVAANLLFNSGADIVYHAAGRCGIGVINAAKEAGKYAIGVDSDQDAVAKGAVLTSMIKRVDNAVYNTIKDAATDKFVPGSKVYSLKDDGVGLSDMKYTKDKIGKENLAKVEAVAAKIKAGTLKVPSTDEEYAKFDPATVNAKK